MISKLWTYLQRLYVHYFVRADRNAKCPACGSRGCVIEEVHSGKVVRMRRYHRILFSVQYGRLLRQCIECSAAWAEEPIVAPGAWAVSQLTDADTEEQKLKLVKG